MKKPDKGVKKHDLKRQGLKTKHTSEKELAKEEPKKALPVKEKKKPAFITEGKNLYFSGFCLTDNKEFALFYVDEKFLLDNNIELSLNKFKLDENLLDMEIDYSTELKEKMEGNLVGFSEMGFTTKGYVDVFRKEYPNCIFYPLKSFFGISVNTLIAVMSEEYGKPIGVLKLQ